MQTNISPTEFKNISTRAEYLVICNIMGNVTARFCNDEKEVKSFLYAANLYNPKTNEVLNDADTIATVFKLENLSLDYVVADEDTKSAMAYGW